MYISYLKCLLGILEITCDSTALRGVKLVSNEGESNANEVCELVKLQLSEYFLHERENFDLPIFFSNDFKGRVYKALYEHEYGETITYKELATKVDSKAYRAVGCAMASNPYFIVVP
ncbi:MAG: methylated-DNA--[protein]-cysteine S-methyltransferase [Bacilli bacterium]